MSFFGLNDERITKNTPFKIFNAEITTLAHAPLSNKRQWLKTPLTLLETLSLSATLSLSHQGVLIKSLCSYCERELGDALFSLEESVTQNLLHYKITEQSSLSLDVHIQLEKQYHIINPAYTPSNNTPPFLTFTHHKTRSTISDQCFLVDPLTPDRTERYYELAYLSKLTDEQKKVVEAGPGVLLNRPKEFSPFLIWQSIQQHTYNPAALKMKAIEMVLNGYPSFSLYPSHDTKDLVELYRNAQKDTMDSN